MSEVPLTSLSQDEYPLASLPLLGYSVTEAGESENIHKDHVFKLHFKSHVYFFRTESEYFFQRYWTLLQLLTASQTIECIVHYYY